MAEKSKRATRLAKRRANTAVLVVCADGRISSNLKQSLHTLGYVSVSAANSHVQGLDRFKTRQFSLVFFDAVSTNMLGEEFVRAIKLIEQDALLVAVSAEPAIDQVFDLLRAGARWFLVQPFTVQSLDEVLERASDGPPFSEGVLDAADRNQALVGMILNALENLTTTMHHIRSFPESPQSVAAIRRAFEESVDLAKTFAEGGSIVLSERIVDACIARATSAPTRLGRVRRKLQRLRDKKEVKPAKRAHQTEKR